MTTIDQLFDEFITEWNAGHRPDVLVFIARAPTTAQDELAARIDRWLLHAPTPEYSDETIAQIRAEPALAAALASGHGQDIPLAKRLGELRTKAGLSVREVAHRLVAIFGLPDDEDRADAYLDRLEHNDLDPGRISRRLLDALAAILGAEADDLTVPVLPGGQALFRAEDQPEDAILQEIDALSRAALTPAPEDLDPLDRLFLGGPRA